jgi:pimeloyl-ACP methyl ester carboxylesterase
VFANLGFYYAAINYRGCDGYGPEYKSLGSTADAARDVVNLYENLVADPSVDAKSVFLITASAGTAVVSELLATRPELWAGVVFDRPGELGIDPRLQPAKLPPILMVMGGLDRGFAAMNAFVAWASTNHVDIKSLVYTNSEHGTYSLAERKETLQQSSEFFLSHLR